MKKVYCDICGEEVSYESAVIPFEAHPKFWMKLILQTSRKIEGSDNDLNASFDLCKTCASQLQFYIGKHNKELYNAIWSGYPPKRKPQSPSELASEKSKKKINAKEVWVLCNSKDMEEFH
jgi:hypothetical protein